MRWKRVEARVRAGRVRAGPARVGFDIDEEAAKRAMCAFLHAEVLRAGVGLPER